jgi:phosphoesterase RecJ-like protein
VSNRRKNSRGDRLVAPGISRAARQIREARRCLLGTHVNPEGDAIGSLLGLALGLESLGKQAIPLCHNPVPQILRFLPGSERVSGSPPKGEFDIAIALDCDGLARLGDLADLFSSAPILVDIDHHSGGNTFGDIRWVDPEASSVGEMVYVLLRKIGAPLSADIATCLYTAILTDTGRFCYSNTTMLALEASAELVRAGAEPARIAAQVYERKSASALKLLGTALARLQQHDGGRIVTSFLAEQDFARAGSKREDTEGIVDQLRACEGAVVSAVFIQNSPGSWRVSMRSRELVDVAQVALNFGGGGHARAAGYTAEGSFEQVQDRLLGELRRAIKP